MPILLSLCRTSPLDDCKCLLFSSYVGPVPLDDCKCLFFYSYRGLVSLDNFKVTAHVGTDQNIEAEIFADNKYTLNELTVNKL